MKKLQPCVITLSLLGILLFGFTSCDSDTSPIPNNESNLSMRKSNALPGNVHNPYDGAGWLHTELLEHYYEDEPIGGGIAQVLDKVEKIADQNSSFNAIKSPYYQVPTVADIQYFMDHPDSCVSDVISASPLTSAGKLSLTQFVHSFLLLAEKESDSDVLYQAVVDYEDTVLKNTHLTEKDRRIILTMTSITRHSAYKAKKKPKKNTDPDWTIFVGNIMAAGEGAEQGTAEAVFKGLVTGIVQNRE